MGRQGAYIKSSIPGAKKYYTYLGKTYYTHDGICKAVANNSPELTNDQSAAAWIRDGQDPDGNMINKCFEIVDTPGESRAWRENRRKELEELKLCRS